MFFRNANAGAPPGAAYQSPLALSAAPQLSSLVGAQANVEKLVEDHLAVQSLIRAYQVPTPAPRIFGGDVAMEIEMRKPYSLSERQRKMFAFLNY